MERASPTQKMSYQIFELTHKDINYKERFRALQQNSISLFLARKTMKNMEELQSSVHKSLEGVGAASTEGSRHHPMLEKVKTT